MSGGGTSLVMSFEELEVWRLRRREATADVVLKAGGKTGLVGMKVMKNGVSSPLNGNVILSVVFPRKFCSAVAGAAGVGANKALVKGSFCRCCKKWCLTAIDLFELVEIGMVIVSLGGNVPFRKLISILKFGWSGSLGAMLAWSSLGTAQLHTVSKLTQPLSSTAGSGRAMVEMPVGIGGKPVRFNH
jgi:hypothetical protein